MSMQPSGHFLPYHHHHHQQQHIKDTQAEFHSPLSFATTTTTTTNNNSSMMMDLFPSTTNNDIVTPSWLLSTPSTTCSSPPPITNEEPKHKRQRRVTIGMEPNFYLKQEDTMVLHQQPSPPSAPSLMTPEGLRSFVQRYIAERYGERTVILLTSRVAQKSYGTEKRFLCPPPTTILSGPWRTTNSTTSSPTPTGIQPLLSIQISGETTQQTGTLEWSTPPTPVLPSTVTSYEGGFLHSSSSTIGKCVSKHLHINDADEKRKRVQVMVNIRLSNNENIGTFASKGIKVISKPSKKRQSLKNIDLCIHHGTTISLFNRIRSQTVSTKYLGVSSQPTSSSPSSTTASNCCFVARMNTWDPFVIWIVDPQRTTQPSETNNTTPHHYHPPPPAMALGHQGKEQLAVHYNQPIVLQCLTTGLVSPIMTIRKVDKGSLAQIGSEALGDPVSQLHKVAFEIQPTMASSPLPQRTIFLACLNDVVGRHKCQTPPIQQQGEVFEQDVSDAAVWTIVGTDMVRFTFAVPPPTTTGYYLRPDIAPFPMVSSVSQGDATLCLWGESFTPALTVYVGDLALATEFKSPEALVCVIPSGLSVKKQPILLVRQDGVIYQTNHTWNK
ncbi:beta-trefoil DNA-binding domain-containing protein [Chlamydoabsidia padenii]|nr:beta-trefoil DNA-binding domain-containing protein [Chlamydoabsidia padenii]